MHLLQYRVDFTPDVDHIGVRKALIRVHENVLGKYLFDGTLLYNVTRLPQVLFHFIIIKNSLVLQRFFCIATGTAFKTCLGWI